MENFIIEKNCDLSRRNNFRHYFNRLDFNNKDFSSQHLIEVLRTPGRRRMARYVEGYTRETKTFQLIKPLIDWQYNKGGVFVDCGCGDSPEVFMANDLGMTGYGLDLMPLMSKQTSNHKPLAKQEYEKRHNVKFFQKDVCENWNMLEQADVVHSNAMISLMSLDDRKLFYKNVFDNLKNGGLFVIGFIKLTNGYDYDTSVEVNLLKEAGFKLLFCSSLYLVKNSGCEILFTK